MEAHILSEKQYRSLSRRILNTLERRFRYLPLNSLKDSRYMLKKPVYIVLEKEKHRVIASLDDIEAFACADTEFEAINGLCEEIIEIYEDLCRDRGSLGPLPSRWLSYLEEIIEPR
jgi:hypothetical protein